ncbi:MAG: bifunctional precorrin-2 dehydrogenase/sirohydrochlorin ferrochelatase [Candidatus Glassbacteria bacterium]|nr:bifunctional precorrin-2 dehydrogenase/sirohydrochlorin ferrochelatase [Candidatus Glassbacteria bacterium]
MAADMHESDAVFYPVFIDLRDRFCLVVGAGEIAVRKAQSLLDAGARVKVVSPAAGEKMTALYRQGLVQWVERGFEESDLEGCFLVIGATGDPGVNRRVYDAAEGAGILANIIDVPELCNFLVPSVMRRGGFQVAVSSGGASPVLAREVRRRLEKNFGPQYGGIVKLLAGLRGTLKQRLTKVSRRREFWEMMIDLEFFDKLDPARVEEEIRERAERCLSQLED